MRRLGFFLECLDTPGANGSDECRVVAFGLVAVGFCLVVSSRLVRIGGCSTNLQPPSCWCRATLANSVSLRVRRAFFKTFPTIARNLLSTFIPSIVSAAAFRSNSA